MSDVAHRPFFNDIDPSQTLPTEPPPRCGMSETPSTINFKSHMNNVLASSIINALSYTLDNKINAS